MKKHIFFSPLRDLSSQLALIDQVLADYKKDKAVALKVASAYIRTLWFDQVDKEDAAAIFIAKKIMRDNALRIHKLD